MTKTKLINLLTGFDIVKVGKYVDYCVNLETEKDKNGGQKNPWMSKLTESQLAEFFKIVDQEGLEFDGKHIYISNSYGKTSIGYDYQAYKNKMYITYPESVIDVGIVRENDVYNSWKESGKVHYKHVTGNPFSDEEIKGAYCVIKNKRGEFLTELSSAEIDKHRKKAKYDNIWKEWTVKMVMKTVIKSAVSIHYQDVFSGMELIDNDNFCLDNPIEITAELKNEIENIATLEGLKECFEKNVTDEKEPKLKQAIIETLNKRRNEINEGF